MHQIMEFIIGFMLKMLKRSSYFGLLVLIRLCLISVSVRPSYKYHSVCGIQEIQWIDDEKKNRNS